LACPYERPSFLPGAMVLRPETMRLLPDCRADSGPNSVPPWIHCFVYMMAPGESSFFRSEIGRVLGFPAKSALPKPLFCANSITTATPRRRQNRPKIVPKPPPSPPQTVRRPSYSNVRLLTPKSCFFRSFSWISLLMVDFARQICKEHIR